MPAESAAASSPPVHTCWPFLPMTIAVPVSWHIGSTLPAAMLAFFSRSKATNLSFAEASRIVEDRAQLRQMARAQQVLAIDEGLRGQQGQRLGLDLDDALAVEIGGGDVIAGQLAVGRGVLAEREQLVEDEVAHVSPCRPDCGWRGETPFRRGPSSDGHDGCGNLSVMIAI